MTQPLIIEYTNLLHKYRDPNAGPVKAFLQKHSSDEVLLRRAKALDELFRLKEQLVAPEHAR